MKTKHKVLTGGGVLLGGVVAAGVIIYFQAKESTEAKVVDVVAEFRESKPADEPARDGLPKQGVYRYAVTGDETITRGIKIERDLPAAAPSLVRHRPGGFEVETRFSEQHIEMAQYALEKEGAYVTFAVTTLQAGPSKTVRERAWSPKLLRMPAAGGAKEWGGDFTAGDLKLSVKSRQLPKETLTVGGESVEVQVVETVQKITGEFTGDRTETFWYSPKTGVIVRYKITSSLKGPTDLDFNADQTLLSLTPEV